MWEPNRPGLGDQVARAVVYFVSLMYMFLGVSIIADRFMASIEVITSQVRTGHLRWQGFGKSEILVNEDEPPYGGSRASLKSILYNNYCL